MRGRGAWAASLPAGVVEAEAVDGRRERARVHRLEGLKPTVVLQQLLDHVLLHLWKKNSTWEGDYNTQQLFGSWVVWGVFGALFRDFSSVGCYSRLLARPNKVKLGVISVITPR